MRITELVAEAMRAPATATPATFATHGGGKAPTVATVATVAVATLETGETTPPTVATVAVATPEPEDADETRHAAIAALINTVIEYYDLSCDVAAVIDDFREWPTADLEIMLANRPKAETVIETVAEWYRIWRPGEAAANTPFNPNRSKRSHGNEL